MKCIIITGNNKEYNAKVINILKSMEYLVLEKVEYNKSKELDMKRYIDLSNGESKVIVSKPRGYGKYIIELDENEIDSFRKAFNNKETLVFNIINNEDEVKNHKDRIVIYKQDNINVVIAYILKKIKEVNHETVY